MGPTGCPETSVTNYHYSLRNSPEELSSQYPLYVKPLGGNKASTGRRLNSVLCLKNPSDIANAIKLVAVLVIARDELENVLFLIPPYMGLLGWLSSIVDVIITSDISNFKIVY